MSTVPVLSALTELLSGAVTEDFKKLFKASALVAAAIFLTLNLLLILPVLRGLDVSAVMALERLSTAWQIAVGTLLLFALAYVLNSLGGTFVRLLSGASLADSPIIGWWLREWQNRTYEGLSQRIQQTTSPQEKSLATQRLALEFPDKDALAPTRLGNVLNAASAYLTNRYGVHLNTIWPFMDIVLQKDDPTLSNQLNENRDALTFLATLSSLLGIVAIELAVVEVWASRPAQALWALAILGVAYLSYSAGVLKAKAWRTDVCTAFELHLDKVREKLQLRALQPSQWKTARERWKDVSRWLAYGGSNYAWTERNKLSELVQPPEDASWYEKPAQAIELAYPDTVTVQKVLQGERLSTEKEGTGNAWVLKRIYTYGYAISNLASGEHALPADGVYLTVTDTRLLVKLGQTEGTLTDPRNYGATPATPPTDKIYGSPQPGAEAKSLLWYVGRIAPATSRLLQYKVPADVLARVTVKTGNLQVVEIALGEKTIRIDLEKAPSTSGQATVEIELPHGEQPTGATVYTLADGKATPVEEPKLTQPDKQVPRWTVQLNVPATDESRLEISV